MLGVQAEVLSPIMVIFITTQVILTTLTALTETLIKGFTIKAGKGFFSGVPASKVAIGLPANSCNAAGTGYVTPENVCDCCEIFKRRHYKNLIGFDYTLALRLTPTFVVS